MKTILLASMLALATLTVSASGSNSSKNVSFKTNQNFQRQFGNVENLAWSDGPEHMSRATFTLSGETVSAFFSAEGEFIAQTAVLTLNDLPQKLKAGIIEAGKNATITEVVELVSDTEHVYFISLKTATGEKILKGYSNGRLKVAKL